MNNINKVLYVGSVGFPFGSAKSYRMFQIASILDNIGYKILVINRKAFHKKNVTKKEKIKVYGNYKGIKYFHTSLNSFRVNNFILRNTFKVLGFVIEILTILYQTLFCNCKLIVCNSSDLFSLKYYFYLSRLLNLKFLYDYVEIIDSLNNRDAVSFNEITFKFDNKVNKYADFYIVISKYIDNHLSGLDSSVKKIILPPTQDFDYFDNVKKFKCSQKYFMYCGSINYINAIKFVINAYSKSIAAQSDILLYLVISDIDSITSYNLKIYIDKFICNKKIFILTHISYELLISYYKSSEALLLPLRNTIQDKARFPFKISEYLASGRPIITSDVGVISEYFIDNENALICIPDDIDSFVEKLNYVIFNSYAANEIGNKGYLLGKNYFNKDCYNSDLLNLII
jgi:glycosyltransferase involved in cell wall biosynthesis